MRARQDQLPVYRITGTAQGLSEDLGSRQVRYLISMAIRTACFLLAVIAWFALGWAWVSGLLFVGAILLPYVSVVVANAGRERAQILPVTVLTRPRRALEAGAAGEPRG
ncbi:MAG: DUF3099 domain-containing protein [Actinomycetota bacterium]|nr:DUF3099 domain-containing protein [Actinomycetota bacterium]